MNVIIAYLETMFSAYPDSPRLLEAKAELLAMMEDAYAAALAAGMSENEAVGKVITEFGNLDELAPTLGIGAELTPGVAPAITPDAPPAAAAPSAARASHPTLSLAEARSFAELRQATAPRLGLGVALIVASLAPLIALTTASGLPGSQLASNVASFIGLMLLVAGVAVGVLVLVGRAQRLAPYAGIERGHYAITPEVQAFTAELATTHSRSRAARLQLAIGLWILAFAPVLAVTVLPAGSSGFAVACSLVLVALGLYVFLPANWAHSTNDLVSAAPGTMAVAEEHSIVGVIASFYWPLVVAGYLAWSFIGSAWATSWIVWPIAGVLFGAVAAGFGAWEAYRRSHR